MDILLISIHALREEGDVLVYLKNYLCGDFYPRPPRGGRRTARTTSPSARGFLSTPSARRATLAQGYIDMAGLFLSTPSARRATRGYGCFLRA